MEDIQPAKHLLDTVEEKVGDEIAREEKDYNNPTSGKSQNARTKGATVIITDMMKQYFLCI